MKRKICEPPKASPHEIIPCELFGHQKHTAVCVNLRAKKICKRSCMPFVQWARKNDAAVDETLKKYRRPIERYLFDNKIITNDLKARVVPVGDFICNLCAKVFQHLKRLETHKHKKHRRQMFQ